MMRVTRVIGAALAFTCASWLLPQQAAAALIVITPTDDDRGSDPMPIDNNFSCCLFDPGQAAVTLAPSFQEAAGLEFNIAGVPQGALITSVSLRLFINNTFGIDNAVLHGFVGNGSVEGADLGVSNLLLSFMVPTTGNQFPLALDVPTQFLQGLVDAGEVFAGFTLRNETPGGGSFSIYTIDWGNPTVHPTLAIEFQVVPEPASLTLLGVGLAAIGATARRRTAASRRRL
jgi:hypothetical protein